MAEDNPIQALLELADVCDSTNWKEQLLKHRERLENSEGIMLGCLEDEWRKINWNNRPNKRDVFDISDHPLGILSFYLGMCTYPPPELLMVIDDMYRKYKIQRGKLSLEDVFFGPLKKGVGNYAARSNKKDHVYRAFLCQRQKKENAGLSDVDLVAKLKTQAEEYREIDIRYWEESINGGENLEEIQRERLKFSMEAPYFDSVDDEESFLRDYRRWKKKICRENETDK